MKYAVLIPAPKKPHPIERKTGGKKNVRRSGKTHK